MTTHSLPRSIPLHRSPALRVLDAVLLRVQLSIARWQARRALHAEWRRAAEAERELAQLSPRTLADIGAPQGLIGQRRWQYEQEEAEIARVLHLRGW